MLSGEIALFVSLHFVSFICLFKLFFFCSQEENVFNILPYKVSLQNSSYYVITSLLFFYFLVFVVVGATIATGHDTNKKASDTSSLGLAVFNSKEISFPTNICPVQVAVSVLFL